MLRYGAWIVSIIVGAVVAMLLAGGHAGQERDSGMQEWKSDLQSRTVPASAISVSCSEIARAGDSASVRWEFDTDWKWEDYHEWVHTRLMSDFTEGTSVENAVEFRRYLSGDANLLRIETLPGGPPLRVRVSLSSHPD